MIGVDIKPQPRYAGDEFIQADAMTFPLDGFDVIHASPPCQVNSDLRHLWPDNDHLDLLTPIRERLMQQSAPWVIENVPGAPMRCDLMLCGSMLDLGCWCHDGVYRQLRRHRWFEASFPMGLLVPECQHRDQPVGVYGHGGGGEMTRGYKGTKLEYQEAMQMPWATKAEIAQAIPPAYAFAIANRLRPVLAKAA